MGSLYFYKLVSPYPEDITKDCKLTVNEIDHNFITLKDADIKNMSIDNTKKSIVLETNCGEKFTADLSNYTQDVSVEYDKEQGIIKIYHDGKIEIIDGLITKDNIAKESLVDINTDGTLTGNGSSMKPIGLTVTEKTSAFKAVKRVIDKTKLEFLPACEENELGDRYLTYEQKNEYGYLYSYISAAKFVQDLNSDWRIPTKNDWDNMLNAIELCEEDKNHDISSCNIVLGKFAGKFLKSQDNWVKASDCSYNPCNISCGTNMNDDSNISDFVDMNDGNMPKVKSITPTGTDAYGMKIMPAGYGDGCMMMDYFGRRAKFWTSTAIQVTNMYVKRFDYNKTGVVQLADNPRALASVRLVKDYNGSNFREIETIHGVNYKCVLLPSNKAPHGYMIWMASNLATSDLRYHPVEPNHGEYQSDVKVFYINEWNGFDWTKKELTNGDSLVIENGPDNDTNTEYRLVNGSLVNIKQDTISTVVNRYDKPIEELQGQVSVLNDEVSNIKNSIADINDKLQDIDNWSGKLEEEIEIREKVDTQIWEAINNEVSARTDVESQIWEAVNKEVSARTDVDTQIWEAVNKEVSARTDVDTQIWVAINDEVSARTDVESQIWEAVNNEIELRQSEDNKIKEDLQNEINRAEAADIEQKGRLISQSGSTYSSAEGVLTLMTDDPTKSIHILLDSNYGTF